MYGDASIMLSFHNLFDSFATLKIIKNIVVFDGGARSKKLNKTTFMVDKFIESAKSVGANVKEYKLSEFDIHHCDGYYTC